MKRQLNPDEFRAVHRYARMGVRKARRITDMIRGMSANQALDVLRHDKHRAAVFVRQVLASAVANAMQDPEVRPNRLMISQSFAQDGPLLAGRLRFRPGPMGRAMPIRRRTCHIHVYVTDPGRKVAAAAAPAAGEGEE